MRHILAAALAALMLLAAPGAAPVAAQEAVFGLGLEQERHDEGDDLAGVFEVWSRPFAAPLRTPLSFGAVLQGDSSRDFWVGLGFLATHAFTPRIFGEASLGAGYYEEGGGIDLGSDLEFRSLLGVGYRVTPRIAVSLAADHKSNGGIGSDNPGVNVLSLRLRHSF